MLVMEFEGSSTIFFILQTCADVITKSFANASLRAVGFAVLAKILIGWNFLCSSTIGWLRFSEKRDCINCVIYRGLSLNSGGHLGLGKTPVLMNSPYVWGMIATR
jgi:hypothetical protein